jgi:hypothetical protein
MVLKVAMPLTTDYLKPPCLIDFSSLSLCFYSLVESFYTNPYEVAGA